MAARLQNLLADSNLLGLVAGLLALRLGYLALWATIAMIAVLTSEPDRRKTAIKVLRLLLPRKPFQLRPDRAPDDEPRSLPPNS